MATHTFEHVSTSFERASAAFVVLLVLVGLVTISIGIVMVNTGAPTYPVVQVFPDPDPTSPADGVVPARG